MTYRASDKSIEIAKILGFFVLDFVDGDGDDCYALHGPKGFTDPFGSNTDTYETAFGKYPTAYNEDDCWRRFCPPFEEFCQMGLKFYHGRYNG